MDCTTQMLNPPCQQLEAVVAQQVVVIEQMRHIIRRYRDDTPLGNQPYMLAHSADEILALQPCQEVLNKVRVDAVREVAKWVGFTTNCNCNLHMMDFAQRIEKGEA